MIREAKLWRRSGDRVVCTACARQCSIPDGSGGFCFIRRNIGGKLVLMSYGVISAMQVDPIEKKPFNHFMPGTYVLGIGTSSCNFGCLFCQNHNISKEREITGLEMTPEQVVGTAIKQHARGIAFTYNEPTIFIEFAIDVAELAHRRGLSTMFVSNGFMTKEAIALMKGKIDAVAVDFKGNGERIFSNKYEMVTSNEPVKEALLEMKKAGIHIEITDLIVPRVGDSVHACSELARWIHDNLGPDTPIQFTRFYPDYKMLDYPQTPFETLQKHYDAAKAEGLNYVYIGNVPGTKYEHTYCPSCGNAVIKREGYVITGWELDSENRCRRCGTPIPIIGKKPVLFTDREISVLY